MGYVENLGIIKDSIGKVSIKTISEKTGMSPSAIQAALHRVYGTTNTKSFTGYVTAGELAKLLSVDRNTVINWTKRYGLPSFKKCTKLEKKFTFVCSSAFWDWADSHKDKIDFSKLEPHSLPIEPSWVEEERKKKKNVRSYRSWTTKQEAYLVSLVQSGKSFKELEVIFERKAVAIEKKYYRLIAKKEK